MKIEHMEEIKKGLGECIGYGRNHNGKVFYDGDGNPLSKTVCEAIEHMVNSGDTKTESFVEIGACELKDNGEIYSTKSVRVLFNDLVKV